MYVCHFNIQKITVLTLRISNILSAAKCICFFANEIFLLDLLPIHRSLVDSLMLSATLPRFLLDLLPIHRFLVDTSMLSASLSTIASSSYVSTVHRRLSSHSVRGLPRLAPCYNCHSGTSCPLRNN